MLSNKQFKKRYYGIKDSKEWRSLYKDGVVDVEYLDEVYKKENLMKRNYCPPDYPVAVCDFNIPVTADCGPTLGCTLQKETPNPDYYNIVDYDWYYDIPKGWVATKKEGNNPMNTINTATANVTQKTDLQTQREYLLGRWNDVARSSDYGSISNKMTDAFGIHVDNRPKTAKELFDGITSGKYTLDADEAARQEIYAAKYGRADFYDIFDAVKWGGLEPDRAGWEKARDDFRDKLKLLKDQIMTGDPAASATALQALEAWTPPAAAVAN